MLDAVLFDKVLDELSHAGLVVGTDERNAVDIFADTDNRNILFLSVKAYLFCDIKIVDKAREYDRAVIVFELGEPINACSSRVEIGAVVKCRITDKDIDVEVLFGADGPHAVQCFQCTVSVISVRKNRYPVFHSSCLQRTNAFESDESVIEESSGISSYPPLKPVTVTLPSPSVVTVSSVCHS